MQLGVIGQICTGIMAACFAVALLPQSAFAQDNPDLWTIGCTGVSNDQGVRESFALPAFQIDTSRVMGFSNNRFWWEEGVITQLKAKFGLQISSWGFNHDLNCRKISEAELATWPPRDKIVDFIPDGAIPVQTMLAGPRRTIAVKFADPASGQKGYSSVTAASGVTFDLEYQFIACLGELHIAYSVPENGVRIGKAAASKGQLSYIYDRGNGDPVSVDTVPQTVSSLSLKGRVVTSGNSQVGNFADGFASQALGWGCFTGQTKEVAKLDIWVGEKLAPQDVQSFLNGLHVVDVVTSDVLTSAAAEEQIRGQRALAKAPGAPEPAPITKAPAPRVVEREPLPKLTPEQEKFASAYDRSLANNAAAQADADAAQAEYKRKQAEYQAEIDRANKEREAYLAKLKQGS